jgi:hypothetical protein
MSRDGDVRCDHYLSKRDNLSGAGNLRLLGNLLQYTDVLGLDNLCGYGDLPVAVVCGLSDLRPFDVHGRSGVQPLQLPVPG